MSANAAPVAETPAKPSKPQNALQVPKFANAIADNIAKKLDDKKKHVIAAALIAFDAMDAETQVALVNKARVSYRGQFE